MPQSKKQRQVEEFTNDLDSALEKTRNEITRIKNELDTLERLLNVKMQHQMGGAVATLPADALIEDIVILESAVRANIQIHDSAFKDFPFLERRLYQFNRLAAILENRLKVEHQALQALEKEQGLVKLDKLCEKYQDSLFTKLGGTPGDTLKRAYINALKVPHLKDKAKTFFDHYTLIEDLRTILSIHPAYQINQHFPPQERRAEFEKLLKANEGFFAGNGTASPRHFKDKEGGKFHLEAMKILQTKTLEKPRKPNKHM